MTRVPQKARSVFLVSHGTVPGPVGGGPVTAPGRRLAPSSRMLALCGRSGVSSGGGEAAPIGTTARMVTTSAKTGSANRFPGRMGIPPSLLRGATAEPRCQTARPHRPGRAGPPTTRLGTPRDGEPPAYFTLRFLARLEVEALHGVTRRRPFGT